MHESIRKTATICSLLTIGIGASGALAWLIGRPLLASVNASFIPMAPLTAIFFIFLGSAAGLIIRWPHAPVAQASVLLISFATGLLTLVKMAEFSKLYYFGMEELLVRNPWAFGAVSVGRMSPISAGFFLITSFVTACTPVRNRRVRTAAGSLAIGLLGCDGVILLGYLYGTPLLYGGSIIPMALTSAFGFCALTIALIAYYAGDNAIIRPLTGDSVRALLLRTFLPISFATVITNALIYRLLPWHLNSVLLAAISGLTAAPLIAILVTKVAGRVGADIDRAQQDLEKANTALRETYDCTLQGWSRALDLRDKVTEGHCQRVSELMELLSRSMGVAEEEIVHMRRGALLHDIGKMGLPDSVLLKPGKLTEDEWKIMRQHPEYAFRMLSPIEYLRPALDIPYCHHEQWDGKGYPRGLKGEEIPLSARIFSVVDIWDALVSERPYKTPWQEDRVRDYIRGISGTQLDPAVVDAFLKLTLPPRKSSGPTVVHPNDSSVAA